MRKWETIGGGALWVLTAIMMISAALQPVEVSAATPVESVSVVSICADGGSSPVMGCSSVQL